MFDVLRLSRTLSFAITTVYAALGDRDEAFAQLERAQEGMVTSVVPAEGAIQNRSCR
jgi:hypothetical protein